MGIEAIQKTDELGAAWQERADRAWQRAIAAAEDAEDALGRYVAPTMPDFEANVSEAVRRRPILGAFIVDQAAEGRPVVHELANARESCGIDGIRSALFVHFWREVAAAAPAAVACARCVGGIE